VNNVLWSLILRMSVSNNVAVDRRPSLALNLPLSSLRGRYTDGTREIDPVAMGSMASLADEVAFDILPASARAGCALLLCKRLLRLLPRSCAKQAWKGRVDEEVESRERERGDVQPMCRIERDDKASLGAGGGVLSPARCALEAAAHEFRRGTERSGPQRAEK
jgi:hypothetical protein